MTDLTANPFDPAEISCWVFDLDNTLYPAASNLFARVSARMTAFICAEYDLEHDAARAFQREMFRRHGTTMRGLMVERGLEPGRFLDYVHDIDVSDMPENQTLARAIERLPGRKVIFTNGTRTHAERIMAQIGVAAHFEDIFDIVDSDYVPKPNPAPYEVMIERFAIDPKRAVMVEDMAKNLAPAAALGMTTVWLRHDVDWAVEGSEDGHVHHACDDLTAWLESVLR